MSLRSSLCMKLWGGKSGFTQIPKTTHVRTLMSSQHVKGSETLLNSISIAVILWYFLISMKENQLEKCCLSTILNLETVC